MDTVLVRLREPVVRLPQEQAEELLKSGLLEEATEYQAGQPAEPKALIRVKESGLYLGSYYNKGEIVGCTEADAAFYVWLNVATAVTKQERDLEVAKVREAEAKRLDEGDLVLVRFLRSWAVFGTYYCKGEVAGFRGEHLEYVLAARIKAGDPFVAQLTPEEVQEHKAKIEANTAAAAAEVRGGTDRLVMVEFLISMSTGGSYYNQGEVAGFSPEKAADLLAAHTLQNEPFVKLIRGVVEPPPPPASGPGLEIPEGVEVAGLTDRDPEGVEEHERLKREAEERGEKGLPRPPKHRMLDSFRRK